MAHITIINDYGYGDDRATFHDWIQDVHVKIADRGEFDTEQEFYQFVSNEASKRRCDVQDNRTTTNSYGFV